MKIKDITFEDFINYKEPSMYIAFPNCSFKCGKELCQNSPLALAPTIEIDKDEVIKKYLANSITTAIVFGGLEPFDSQLDLLPFIDSLRMRYECDDPVIIYTGYTEEELESGHFGKLHNPERQKEYYQLLLQYSNIIIKFGRYQPNQPGHMDPILGVKLASPNQYAKLVSKE